MAAVAVVAGVAATTGAVIAASMLAYGILSTSFINLGISVAADRETGALRRLDADPSVELIVVVSKPPAEEVAAELREYAAGLGTPVEFALLGSGQPDLTAATESVLRRLGTTTRAPMCRWVRMLRT